MASRQREPGSMVAGGGGRAMADLFMRPPDHEVCNGVGRFVGSDSGHRIVETDSHLYMLYVQHILKYHDK